MAAAVNTEHIAVQESKIRSGGTTDLTGWIGKGLPELTMEINGIMGKFATAYTKLGTAQTQLVFMNVPYLKDTQLSLLLIDVHFWWIHCPRMHLYLLCKISPLIFFANHALLNAYS